MLNTKQKEIAAQNHHIIKEFLSQKGLTERDHYDVVVFGYLRAVTMCDHEGSLHGLAMTEMEKDFAEYRAALADREREISLERLDVQYPDINREASDNPGMKRFINILNSAFSDKEQDLIHRLQQGYKMEVAAADSRLTITDADTCVKRARFYAKSLRCA